MNPGGKVPLIKFDVEWIPDSAVIVGRIEHKYPQPSLHTPPERASVYASLVCLDIYLFVHDFEIMHTSSPN